MQDSAPEDQPCPQGPGRPELTRACRAPPGLGFLLTSKVARASRLKVTRGRGDLWGCVGTPPTSDASLMHAAACRQYLPRTSLERLRQLSVASGTAASLYSFRALQNLSQGSLTRTRIGPLALLLGRRGSLLHEIVFSSLPSTKQNSSNKSRRLAVHFVHVPLPFRAECRFCSSACPASCLCNVTMDHGTSATASRPGTACPLSNLGMRQEAEEALRGFRTESSTTCRPSRSICSGGAPCSSTYRFVLNVSQQGIAQ